MICVDLVPTVSVH